MITFPRAKINFGLRIIRKRQDGYHDIETIFYPVGLCDALEFVIAPEEAVEDNLTVTGIDIKTKNDKNLVIRVLKEFRKKHKLPFLNIHLHKAIPSGAGLGGGSSDAACFLKTIRRCFNLTLSDAALRSMALELGSDCPFFLDPVPSFARGRGEQLTPVDAILEGFHIVLLNPGIHISTREAYLNCRPGNPEYSLKELTGRYPGEWKDLVKNDFEDFAFRLYPKLGEIKRSLYREGAVYASMSGSGSTIYGLFETRPELGKKLKDMSIYEGML
jgi:4-diphosphocytidyl-2-C-methyl-D-erythritol kinase